MLDIMAAKEDANFTFNLTFCCFSLHFSLYIVFTNLKLNQMEICISDFSFNGIT